MPEPVKLVCFDLGGVVVRICRSWEEACVRAGVEVRDMEMFRAPEAAARRRALTRAHQTGAMEDEAYFAAIAEASGGLYDAREVRLVHRAWLIEDYPGVEPLIAGLRDAPGVRTACLSNTNAAHWEALHRAGFGPAARPSAAIARLDRRLVSHELRAVKPEESIYAMAERACGVAPSGVLFFDDTPENVEAARRRGWRAEIIDPDRDTAPQIAAHLLSHGVTPGRS